MKKQTRIHRKDEKHIVWQAARLEGRVKNAGIKPGRKPRQTKKIARPPVKRRRQTRM
jgi:hypothetical protein